MFQECSEADHKVHYWRKVRREEGGREGGRRREEEVRGKREREERGRGRGWEGGERINQEREDIQRKYYDHTSVRPAPNFR